MFESAFLEVKGGKQAAMTTTFSFLVELVVLAAAIIIPLFFVESPDLKAFASAFLVAPPPPPPPPPPAAAANAKPIKVENEIDNSGKLKTPTKIPEKVMKDVEEEPTSGAGGVGVVGGVPGGVPGGQIGGVLGSILSSAPQPAAPKIATPVRIRVSQGVTEGLSINRVKPVYPPLAKAARIQGQVVLHAIISKNGTIEGLNVISGHPMLIQAALDAVRQWRYKPYLLNGEPVEVETVITVNFSLSGG
jgi:protein TonB